MVALIKRQPGFPYLKLNSERNKGHILIPCSCGMLVRVPIMPGFLVHVRCHCNKMAAYLWPFKVSRWSLLEID